MKKIRIGNDFVFSWAIERGGVPEALETVLEKHLYMIVNGTKTEITDYIVLGNNVIVEFTSEMLKDTGTYTLLFNYILPDASLSDNERKCTVDVDAFKIVPKTSMADDTSEFSVTSDMAIAFKGDKGDSAYQVWLDEGHSGTIDDYLAYLQQPALDAAEVANTAAGLADEKALLADDAANLANEVASHPQKIQTGTWWYWDVDNDVYVDSGIAATPYENYLQFTEDDPPLDESTWSTYSKTQGDYAREQGDYAKGIGDSYDAVKLDKTAVDIYNVTLAVPLPAGSYYNSTSARAAVPVAVRKKGLELIYETSAGIWYKERYVGVDVANWTAASNWEIVPLKSHIENNEEVIAAALVELKNKIDALQNIIKEMILGSVQIDNLDIVKNLNIYGSSNMILTGTAAPTVVPDFIGQFFIKTTATTACYQATGNSSVNDWKQIG